MAKTLYVGSDQDYTTLTAAINAAADGDTIILKEDVTAVGLITIDSKDITVDLGGFTLDAQVYLREDSDVEFKNGSMTYTNTDPGSGSSVITTGIYTDENGNIKSSGGPSALTLTNVKVEGGEAVNSRNYTHAVTYKSTGGLTITDCTITGGTATRNAECGSIGSNSSTAVGIYAPDGSAGDIVIKNSTVTGGYGKTEGEYTGYVSQMFSPGGCAISLHGSSAVTIIDSTVTGGGSNWYNAATAVDVSNQFSGTLSVQDSTVKGGKAEGAAGNYGTGGVGIYTNMGTSCQEIAISGSTISGGDGGKSFNGIGIEYRNADIKMTITDSTVESGNGENASGNGAALGIYNSDSTQIVLDDVKLNGAENEVIKGGDKGIAVTGPVEVVGGTLKNTKIDVDATGLEGSEAIITGDTDGVDISVSGNDNAAVVVDGGKTYITTETNPTAADTSVIYVNNAWAGANENDLVGVGKFFGVNAFADVNEAEAVAEAGAAKMVIAEGADVTYDKDMYYFLNTNPNEGGENNAFDNVVDAEKTYDMEINGTFRAYQILLNNANTTIGTTGKAFATGEAFRVMGGSLTVQGSRAEDAGVPGEIFTGSWGGGVKAGADTQISAGYFMVNQEAKVAYNDTVIFVAAAVFNVDNAEADFDNAYIYLGSVGTYADVQLTFTNGADVTFANNTTVINADAFDMHMTVDSASSVTVADSEVLTLETVKNSGSIVLTGDATLKASDLANGCAITITGLTAGEARTVTFSMATDVDGVAIAVAVAENATTATVYVSQIADGTYNAMVIDGTSVKPLGSIAVKTGSIAMDATSTIIADTYAGSKAITVTVDLENFSGVNKIIDLAAPSSDLTLNYVDAAGKALTVEELAVAGINVFTQADGDVLLANVDKTTLFVDGNFNGEFGEEIAEDKYFGLNAFNSFAEALKNVGPDTGKIEIAGDITESATSSSISVVLGKDLTISGGNVTWNAGSNWIWFKTADGVDAVNLKFDNMTLGGNNDKVFFFADGVTTTIGKGSSITMYNGAAQAGTVIKIEEGGELLSVKEAFQVQANGDLKATLIIEGAEDFVVEEAELADRQAYLKYTNVDGKIEVTNGYFASYDYINVRAGGSVTADNSLVEIGADINGTWQGNPVPNALGQLKMAAGSEVTVKNGSVLKVSGHITNSGTLNIEDGTFIADGAVASNGAVAAAYNKGVVTNNGTINVSGESTLVIRDLAGNALTFGENATLVDSNINYTGSNVFGLDGVTFKGDNTINAASYSTSGAKITVAAGASLTANGGRWAFGSNALWNINGSIENVKALTNDEKAALTASLSVNGLSLSTGGGEAVMNVKDACFTYGDGAVTTKNTNVYGGKMTMNFENSYVASGSKIAVNPTKAGYDAANAPEVVMNFKDSVVEINNYFTNNHAKGTVTIDNTDFTATAFGNTGTVNISKGSEVNFSLVNNGLNDWAGKGSLNAGTITVDASDLTIANAGATLEFYNVGAISLSNGAKFTLDKLVNAEANDLTGGGNINTTFADMVGNITLDNTSQLTVNTLFTNNGSISLDATSSFIANTLDGDGSITIDATGFTEGINKVIDLNGTSSLKGKVTVNGLEEGTQVFYLEDGDVVLSNADLSKLYVSSEYAGKKFGDDLGDGKFFGINAFADFDSAVELLPDNNSTIYLFSDAEMSADPGFKLNVVSGDGEKHTLKIDSVIDVDAEFAKEIDIEAPLFMGYYNNHQIVVNGDLKGGFYNYTGSMTFNNSKITDSYDNSNIGGVVTINGDGSWTLDNAQAENLKFINVGRSDWLGQGILNLNDTVVKAIQYSVESNSADAKSQINVKNSTLATVLNDGGFGNLLIGTNGEVNLTDSNLIVVGTLTNNGTVTVTGESTLDINSVSGKAILVNDGATVKDSSIGGEVHLTGGKTAWSGTNTVSGIFSAGYTNYGGDLSTDITGTFTSSNMLVWAQAGYETVVNIGSADAERTTFNGGQIGEFENSVINVTNADVEYNYAFIRGEVNVSGSTFTCTNANTYTGGNAVITVDNSTWNAGAFVRFGEYDGSYGNSDIKLQAGAVLNVGNLNLIEAEGKTVQLAINGGTLNSTGVMDIGAGAEVIVNSGSLTSTDTLTNNGSITINALSTLTADSIANNGTITIDATGFTGTRAKVIDLNQEAALSGVKLKGTGYYLEYAADGDVSIVKSPDTVYVSSDYNSSTEGWGYTHFANYDSAVVYIKNNAKKATMVIEKTTTISGNCFQDSKENLGVDLTNAVIVKDGAVVGNAQSKWDMTYSVTLEGGAILQSARPGDAITSIGNTHIKNVLTIGDGSEKRAEVRFIQGLNGITYKTMSIALLSGFNRKLVANNALIEVGDLGINAAASFTDTTLTIAGILAIKGTSLYKTTMTDTTVTINGHNLMNENTYYSTVGTILATLTMDNTSITVDDGSDSTAAEKVWLGYTGNVAQTLTMNNGSVITIEKGAEVEVANKVIMTDSKIVAGDINAGTTKYAGSNSFYFNSLEKGKVYWAVLYDADGNELETIERTSTSGSTFYPKFSVQPAGDYKAVCYKDEAKTEIHQEKTYSFTAVGTLTLTNSELNADKLILAGNNLTMDYDSTVAFGSVEGGYITVSNAADYVDNADVVDGTYKLLDYTGTAAMAADDYKVILNDAWHDNYLVFNNDLYLTDQDTSLLRVSAEWKDAEKGSINPDGSIIGFNAAGNVKDLANMINTDGRDTTVKFHTDMEVVDTVDFAYGTGDILFTADQAVTIAQTSAKTDFGFTLAKDITVTVGENVTFQIYDNASGWYQYYGPSLELYGTITGGQNWGCTYLFNGEHTVHSTGTLSTGRVQLGFTTLNVEGDAESERTAAHIDTNYLLVEGSTFNAENAIVEAGIIHDSNNGGMRWGASEFYFNGSTLTGNMTIQYAESIVEFNNSDVTLGTLSNAGTVTLDSSTADVTKGEVFGDINVTDSTFTAGELVLNGCYIISGFQIQDSDREVTLVFFEKESSEKGRLFQATVKAGEDFARFINDTIRDGEYGVTAVDGKNSIMVNINADDGDFNVYGNSSVQIDKLSGTINVDNANLTDSKIVEGSVEIKGENTFSGTFNADYAYVGDWNGEAYAGSIDFGTASDVNVGTQMIIGYDSTVAGANSVVFGSASAATEKAFKSADVSVRRDGVLTIQNTTGENKINTMNVMGKVVIDKATLSGEVQIGNSSADIDAEMIVRNGAVVNLGGSENSIVILGKSNGGTLTVDNAFVDVKRCGSGSSYEVVPADTFVVGYNGGTGVLNIVNNGEFNVQYKMSVSENSSVSIENSTLEVGGTLTNAGDITVAGNSTVIAAITGDLTLGNVNFSDETKISIKGDVTADGDVSMTHEAITGATNFTVEGTLRLLDVELPDADESITLVDGKASFGGLFINNTEVIDNAFFVVNGDDVKVYNVVYGDTEVTLDSVAYTQMSGTISTVAQQKGTYNFTVTPEIAGGFGGYTYTTSAYDVDGNEIAKADGLTVIISEAELTKLSNSKLTFKVTATDKPEMTYMTEGVEAVLRDYHDARRDFDANGVSDIAVFDEENRTFSFIAGQADGSFSKYQIDDKVEDASWKCLGTGYMNSGKTQDVLWVHDSGEVGVWLVNGSSKTHQTVAGATSDWKFLAIADVTGDGRDNIIWQHETGTVLAWESGANAVHSGNKVLGGVDIAEWNFAGTGDVTGDGVHDILWRHTDGLVGFWNSSDGSWVSLGSADEHWTLLETGDFDNDGVDEVLWQNDSGLIGAWDYDHSSGNVAWNSFGDANTLAGYDFSAVGDYNGDGFEDILWCGDGTDNYKVWSIENNEKKESVDIKLA